MVKRVTTEILCDIDNNPAEHETELSINGDAVTIDLCESCYGRLIEATQTFFDNGTTLKLTPQHKKATHVRTGPDPKAVRAWAEANGLKVPKRGRLPFEAIDAFLAAGN